MFLGITKKHLVIQIVTVLVKKDAVILILGFDMFLILKGMQSCFENQLISSVTL